MRRARWPGKFRSRNVLSNSQMKRRCPRCGDRKPVDEFLPDPSTGDGMSELCKECESERTRLFGISP